MGEQKKYRCIVADPPWAYPEVELWGRPEVKDHYNTMATGDICLLPVADLGQRAGCHLWLWTPTRHLLNGDAVKVCEAWGFKPKQLVTWCKKRMGLGYYLRAATEHVIFAVVGKLPTATTDMRTYFFGEWRGHSTKPQEFYDLVVHASPPPRLDIFARVQREGWDVLGDELLPDLFSREVDWPE